MFIWICLFSKYRDSTEGGRSNVWADGFHGFLDWKQNSFSHLGTCVCGECSCHDVDPTGDWGDIHGDTCECDERDCRSKYDRYSDDFCSGKAFPHAHLYLKILIFLFSGFILALTNAIKETINSATPTMMAPPIGNLEYLHRVCTFRKLKGFSLVIHWADPLVPGEKAELELISEYDTQHSDRKARLMCDEA